ncbi:hypothetical protein [Paraferrimonas sp. SM1919]|uniref:hypothetical protein n=1 Tax=Paraferrimonas sp. SM1919 TaxID=2662263 RepID=UPI0013D89DC4|nr:hypothetical protein [Paraferrimonas sp. SM1919]
MSYLIALIIYIIFWLWYCGLGTKVSQKDIDLWYQQSLQLRQFDEQHLIKVKQFFEQDDGKEFVMVNALQLKSPKSESLEHLQSYAKKFFGFALIRACHPLLAGKVIGNNIELIGIPATNWDSFFLVRYRSRKDLLATMQHIMGQDHQLKLLALDKTFAAPVSPRANPSNPKLLVGLLLLALAGLAHLQI